MVWYLLISLLIQPILFGNQPNTAETHAAFARECRDKELFSTSIEHFLKAIELGSHNLAYKAELANLYVSIGETQKAIALYAELVKIMPNNTTLIYNMGFAYKMQGDSDKAIELYKRTIALDNTCDAAHFALGMAYLNKGDFETGWKLHARYLKQTDRNGEKLRSFLAESTTQGKRILLRPEGGLGDTIHFIRYARELKRYGIHVVVSVQEPLYQLLQNCAYIDELVKIGDSISPVHDYTTLMSIPAILHDHEHKLPTFSPYIAPNPALVNHWGDYLAHDHNFKIGICWEASVYNDSSRPPAARRGMPLELYYLLAEVPNVSLYSLQQADGLEQIADIPPYFKLNIFDTNFDKTNGSFMDTAAVMQHMDLIITVDTAIAHLAGAMGRPVWLLLPWATDWRWITHRKDSPWYPTMRIFKQPTPFDWQTPIIKIFLKLLTQQQKLK